MRFKVSEKAQGKTTQCCCSFSCLDSATKKTCEILDVTAGDLIFIKGPGMTNCKYCHTYGDSYFCSCPVRKEIFVKYRI